MELKVDIEFNQLLRVIKQLPDDKISQLKAELSSVDSAHTVKSSKKFQKLLLNGPVMDDDQYKTFRKNRKYFNKWRTT